MAGGATPRLPAYGHRQCNPAKTPYPEGDNRQPQVPEVIRPSLEKLPLASATLAKADSKIPVSLSAAVINCVFHDAVR
jgi:hypothetical protein